MEFGDEPKEKKKRSIWPFLLAGVVVIGLLFLVFWTPPKPVTPPAPAVKPLPFGPAEQGYAPQVKFEHLKMSRFENMFKQQVTYVDGDIYNSGNRTVADVQIQVDFLDVENHLVFHQTLRPMEPKPVAIPPGGRQVFRLAFDQLPDTWNENYPKIRITGLLLR